jgi:hypothetical protein
MKKTRIVMPIAALYSAIAIGTLGSGGYVANETLNEWAEEAAQQQKNEQWEAAQSKKLTEDLTKLQASIAAQLPMTTEMMKAVPNAPYPPEMMTMKGSVLIFMERTPLKSVFLKAQNIINNPVNPNEHDAYSTSCGIQAYLAEIHKIAIENYKPGNGEPLTHTLEEHMKLSANTPRCGK